MLEYHKIVFTFMFVLYGHPFVGQNLCIIKSCIRFFFTMEMDFIHICPNGRYRCKVYLRSSPTRGVTVTDLEFSYKSHIFALKFIYAQNDYSDVLISDGV